MRKIVAQVPYIQNAHVFAISGDYMGRFDLWLDRTITLPVGDYYILSEHRAGQFTGSGPRDPEGIRKNRIATMKIEANNRFTIEADADEWAENYD